MMAPRLLAAFGTDRGRWHTAVEIQQLSGIAPVTEQSGQGRWVHWRLGCPKFLRQSFHEFADHSSKWCTWAKASIGNNELEARTPSRCARSGLQVDSHPLPLLEGASAIQRKPVPRLPGAPPLFPGGSIAKLMVEQPTRTRRQRTQQLWKSREQSVRFGP